MPKPRRVSALSSVLKETQEYNKVTQEDEQVISTPVEQETAKTEKQISVDTDKHLAVKTETQTPVTTEKRETAETDRQKAVKTEIQEAASTETQTSVNTGEKLHKQTIAISEDLAFRLKVHAARRKETIASIAIRAFEKLLAEEENS